MEAAVEGGRIARYRVRESNPHPLSMHTPRRTASAVPGSGTARASHAADWALRSSPCCRRRRKPVIACRVTNGRGAPLAGCCCEAKGQQTHAQL
jgi:hypothetical protein